MTRKNKFDYNLPKGAIVDYNSQKGTIVNYNSQNGIRVDYNNLDGALDKKNIPEDSLVDISMRNVLLKAYSQPTQKDFLNVKGKLNEFILLYLNSKQPVDFEKMLEDFSLTKDEEKYINTQFPNYPNLDSIDMKVVYDYIGTMFKKLKFKPYIIK